MIPIRTKMRRRFAAIVARTHLQLQRAQHCERGSATAEYAIAALAAAAFAGLLMAVISSPEIRKALSGIITKALQTR